MAVPLAAWRSGDFSLLLFPSGRDLQIVLVNDSGDDVYVNKNMALRYGYLGVRVRRAGTTVNLPFRYSLLESKAPVFVLLEPGDSVGCAVPLRRLGHYYDMQGGASYEVQAVYRNAGRPAARNADCLTGELASPWVKIVYPDWR
jgi:hypothetical protein